MPPDVKPNMVSSTPSAKDINQGSVGDCWFLGSIPLIFKCDAVAEMIFGFNDPEIILSNSFGIQSLLSNPEVPAHVRALPWKEYDGKFTFQFWSHDRWVKVEIDDRLPCAENDFDGSKYYTLLAAQVSDDSSELAIDDTICEFWVPLLEKAYAKFKGGYAAIEAGSSYEAFADLMGAVGEKFEIKKMVQKFGFASSSSSTDELSDVECGKVFSKLMQLDELGALMTVALFESSYNGSLGPIENGT